MKHEAQYDNHQGAEVIEWYRLEEGTNASMVAMVGGRVVETVTMTGKGTRSACCHIATLNDPDARR